MPLKSTIKKNHWNTRRKTRKHTGSTGNSGGSPIAAGGFGCVFKPPIRCTSYGPDVQYDKDGVSKLMLEKHAKTEMAEIKRVLPYAKKIPNFQKYFLLDGITTCAPGTLSTEDKSGYNEKCRSLRERGYTEENVNSKRADLRLINIPYGGEDIDSFWSAWKRSKATKKVLNRTFAETNNALIDLLVNAIRPLNAKGYVHLDLKGQNILRRVEEVVEVRIIDWGLSGAVLSKGVPSNLQDRVIQYNVPFSNILFATQGWPERMKRDYTALAASPKLDHGTELGRNTAMRIIAYQQFHDIADNYGQGHLEYLQQLFTRLFAVPAGSHAELSRQEENYFSPVNAAIDYNAAILTKYMDSKGKFDSGKYFREVFSKNVDVWGFLMAYLPIIDTKSEPWKTGTLENAITRIICEYCFSSKYAAEPIPIDKLAQELRSLNVIIGEEKMPKAKPKAAAKAKPKATAKAKPKAKPKATARKKLTRKLVVVSALPTKKDKVKGKPAHITVVKRGLPFEWESKKRCPGGSSRCPEDKKLCCPAT